MTLRDLLGLVQEAIEEFDQYAVVVLHQTNNQYGANFGRLSPWQLFEAEESPECENCGTEYDPTVTDTELCPDCMTEAEAV